MTRPVGNPCTWRIVTYEEAFAGGTVIEPDPGTGYEYFAHADGAIGRRWTDGIEEKGFRKECSDGGGGFVWVDVTVSIQDVIADATARVRQLAPLPTMNVNPAPEAGGFVNLGLWLAVDTEAPAPVRVEAGGHWAVASLTPVSTTWSFGNGDSLTCDGLGEPIADATTVEQGPCGYTYETSSPDGSPFQLSATLTWSVDYVSSGGSGHAGTIDRTVSVPYDVDEIQSVGEESRSLG